jgi:hypothetical protein
VLTEQMDTKFKPKYIIPFRIDRENIKGYYKRYLQSRPFTPGELKSRATIDKIKAVYVPFWLYHMDLDGELVVRGERTSTHSDSNYVYTTHRIYDVYRSGSLKLENLPVDASSKTPDDAMDSIEPFDYSQMVPFRMAYMAGFLAERYDQDQDFCHRRAGFRANNTMEKSLKDTISGYTSTTVMKRNIREKNPVSADYALLPVYLLSTSYGGKNILYAINGQTGKIVGNVPIAKWKAGLTGGIFFLISLVLSLSILWYL